MDKDSTGVIIKANQTSVSQRKLFLIAGILAYTLILAALVNFVTVKTQKQPLSSSQTQTQPRASVENLPIGLEILTHPMVYQWKGSVEGLLTEKTTNTITLTKDGNKLTIPVDPKGTVFFDSRTGKTDKGTKPTTLDNIPIGSYLRGEFYTAPIPGDKNKIAGSLFTVDVDKSQ